MKISDKGLNDSVEKVMFNFLICKMKEFMNDQDILHKVFTN